MRSNITSKFAQGLRNSFSNSFAYSVFEFVIEFDLIDNFFSAVIGWIASANKCSPQIGMTEENSP